MLCFGDIHVLGYIMDFRKIPFRMKKMFSLVCLCFYLVESVLSSTLQKIQVTYSTDKGGKNVFAFPVV